MKKMWVIMLAVVMLVAGCSSGGGKEEVTVTLPASMFGGQDSDSIIADAEKDGAKNVVVNDDGSLTYSMSKSDHDKMMKEFRDGIVEYVDELKSDGTFASVKDVAYNDSFDEFTITVDQEAFEGSMDGFVTLGVGMQGTLYQIFAGVAAEDQKVDIHMKDAASGEVFNTITYPDALASE